MAIFSNTDIDPNLKMDTRCYTKDRFDAMYLWFSCEYIEKNGNSNVKFDPKFRYRILRDFCYQMELVGMWTFAVYAIIVTSKSIVPEGAKRKWIIDILVRNNKPGRSIQVKGEGNKLKHHKIALEKFGVDKRLFKIAKAVYYQSEFQYQRAISNLIEARQWQTLHRYICFYAAPGLIINEFVSRKEEKLLKSAEFLQRSLEILEKENKADHWKERGAIILKFCQLILDNSTESQFEDAFLDKFLEISDYLNRLDNFRYSEIDSNKGVTYSLIEQKFLEQAIKTVDMERLKIENHAILTCVERDQGGFLEDKTSINLKYIEKFSLL